MWLRVNTVLMAFCLVTASALPAWAGDNRLVHETVLDASVDEVWKVLTTSEGWVSGLGVAQAEVDFKVGGIIRTHYDPNGKLGDSKTIENTILSYDPKRMLSFKATKAPEGFPFSKVLQNMWSVMYLEPLGPKQARLTLIGLGYTDDEESQKMRQHFERGNAWTLERLKKKFAAKDAAPTKK